MILSPGSPFQTTSGARLPLYSSPVLTRDGRRLPTHGSAVRHWIQSNFRLGGGDQLGQPFRLTSYQGRWIDRLFEYYPESGLFRYKRALFGTGKGGGKTPFEGALGAEGICGPTAPKDPLVLMAAASLGQSNLVFGDMKKGMTEDTSPLKPFLDAHLLTVQLRDVMGEAKRVAAATGTNDGPRATRFLADELHEWLGLLRDAFTILDGAIGKRRNAFTVCTSTAGADLDTLLGQMYQRCKLIAGGEIADDETLFEWYEIPDWVEVPERIETEADLEQWREAVRWANPGMDEAGLPSPSYVRSRFDGAQTIDRLAWFRYHGNRWTRAAALWLPAGRWVPLGEPDRSPRSEDPVVLTFCGSYDDRGAALAGFSAPDHVFLVDAWEPPPGAAEDWQVDRDAVTATLEGALARYRVSRVLVDDEPGWRTEWQGWAKRWGRRLFVPYDTDHLRRRFTDACQSFYNAVVTGAVHHDGSAVLARHLASVQARGGPGATYLARSPGSLAARAAVMAWEYRALLGAPKGGGFVGVTV